MEDQQTTNSVSPVELPDAARNAIEADMAAAGEPMKIDVDGLARTMFDDPASEDGTVTVLTSAGNLSHCLAKPWSG